MLASINSFCGTSHSTNQSKREELLALLEDVGLARTNQEMEMLFDLVDRDRNGCISLDELQKALGKLNEDGRHYNNNNTALANNGQEAWERQKTRPPLQRQQLQQQRLFIRDSHESPEEELHLRTLEYVMSSSSGKNEKRRGAGGGNYAADDGNDDDDNDGDGERRRRLPANPPTKSTAQQQRLAADLLSHAGDPERGSLGSFLPGHLQCLDGCLGPCSVRCECFILPGTPGSSCACEY